MDGLLNGDAGTRAQTGGPTERGVSLRSGRGKGRVSGAVGTSVGLGEGSRGPITKDLMAGAQFRLKRPGADLERRGRGPRWLSELGRVSEVSGPPPAPLRSRPQLAAAGGTHPPPGRPPAARAGSCPRAIIFMALGANSGLERRCGRLRTRRGRRLRAREIIPAPGDELMRPKPNKPGRGLRFAGRLFFRGPERLRNRPKVTQRAGRGGRREAGRAVGSSASGPMPGQLQPE